MRTSLIIGAGQLGSRHLQGLVKYNGKMEIYVLDPSMDSLKIAQQREKEIIHEHKIIYSQSWDTLPHFFDLVIIATGANVRESITNKLLEKHKVKFLILEKILFQDLGAYQRVHDLLDKYQVTAFVNHPRRMFHSYENLKNSIKTDEQYVYSIIGGNWGLGCNALHFLDLFVYLSGKKIQDINVNSIDDQLVESPRKGFVEFTGTLTGHLEDQSFFSITSLKGTLSSITATICNNEQRFVIQEGGTPQVYELRKENLFKLENREFKIQYQSELTANIAAQLFETAFCSLPTFSDARHTHELFIKSMLEKYNKITGLNSEILPIT